MPAHLALPHSSDELRSVADLLVLLSRRRGAATRAIGLTWPTALRGRMAVERAARDGHAAHLAARLRTLADEIERTEAADLPLAS